MSGLSGNGCGGEDDSSIGVANEEPGTAGLAAACEDAGWIDLLSTATRLLDPASIIPWDPVRCGHPSPSGLISLLFRSDPESADRRCSDRLSKAAPALDVLNVSELA